ncbi:MAG: acetylxylan esterase [Planctomycetaceae bacterium]|nr:acetylxylan esterase [Planctomycetaceae bacterium]
MNRLFSCSTSLFGLVGLLALSLLAAAGRAAPPRVLPQGQLPKDARLGPPKDLNGYFPLVVPKTKEEWEARAAVVRRQMLVSQGLWPLPAKTPLNPVIHGLIDREDYTIEKVYFQSMPGFFVTGSLYRPKNKSGKAPGVLSPHGHWADGRFHDAGRQNTRKEIVKGAERFEDGGRSPLQSRQVQLARMGCVVFHYDMIGYADSMQLSFDLVHRFGKQRPELNTPENWGLFSPQAESHLQSAMGLQTWNSLRALDFLLSLPEVDPARIAVSGASGGGTQTFMLAAVDPRVALAFPAVMVSTAMQGGCTCENASCLRVETGNIEIAGLFAPKPLGMTAADDWTREMKTKGFPELQSLYELMGAPKNVELFNNTHFGHNYNYVSRSAFYSFLNKHFQLGLEEPVVEEDYRRLSREELTVWDAEHPRPPGGVEFERKLARYWHDDAQQQLAAIAPKDSASLAKWREVVGGGVAAIVGRDFPKADDVEFEKSEKTDLGDYFRFAGIVRNKKHGEELPMAFVHPKKWNKQIVLWLSERGKSAIFGDDGSPSPEARRLMDEGISVAGIDLLFQGEFTSDGQPAAKNRAVGNNREFAGYTYGYNHALLAQRAHDVLTALAFIRYDDQKAEGVTVVALDGTAPIAAVAASRVSGPGVDLAIDTHGFRFIQVGDYLDTSFLPGGAKYGDIPGFLSLATDAKLWLAGETAESAALVKSTFAAAGKPNEITLAGEKATASAVIDWLVK